MEYFFKKLSDIFDTIHAVWENKKTHQYVSVSLVVIFLAALVLIEINRQGWFSVGLGQVIPLSHYKAIHLAFSLVLTLEVISMIFTLPNSMSRALGKQFEILALIFLRNCFKELSSLPEPIAIAGHHEVLRHIMAYGLGALGIFALLGIYLLQLQKMDEVLLSEAMLTRYIRAKKTVALLMVVIFFSLGIYRGWLAVTSEAGFSFFQYFYTVLIFSDVLLVFIAQAYLPWFSAIFRNSGYAVSTLMIRFSLTAKVYDNIFIGVFSILFALMLTTVYNRFYKSTHDTKH